MNASKTTHEVLASLTPREAEVLRKRFGLINESEETATPLPPGNDEEDGSGGVPAPAKPPS